MTVLARIVVLFLFSSSVLAEPLRVPEVYPDIQSAVDAAQNGDVILISASNEPYKVLSPIDVRGKSLTLRGEGKDNSVISGEGVGTILTIRNNDTNLLVVVEDLGFENGQSTEEFHGGCVVVRNSYAIIRNSRFEGCRNMAVAPGQCDDQNDPNRPPQCGNSGGAIKVSVGSSVVLEHNQFLHNRSYVQGGAVHVLDSNAVVRNNRFVGNISEGSPNSGGGGFKATGFGGQLIELIENHFENNQSSFTGGAISVFDGSARIQDNVIINNGEPRFGGGIHFETTGLAVRRLELIGNLIEGNRARDRDDPGLTDDFVQVSGGGMHLNLFGPDRNTFTDSIAVIRGNVFRGNSAHDQGCEARQACGVGGGMEFLRGRNLVQQVDGNVFENNTADIYAAANFDKVNLLFSNNTVRANKALIAHPGIGCVADSNRATAPCEIFGNLFEANRYVATDFEGTGRLNDTAAINVRRNSARIYNNVFAGNIGFHSSIFIRHEDVDGAYSEVAHNTFVGEQQASVNFGVLYLRGKGLFQSNLLAGGKRGFRIDAVESNYDLFARFNNITDTDIDLARIDRLFEDPTIRLRISDIDVLNAQPEADENSILAPDFIAGSGSDFRLSESSPLIDRAPCLDWVRVDFLGNPRSTGNGCDIGAFEFFIDYTIFRDRFEID